MTVIYFDLGDCLTFKHTVSPRDYDELMKDFRTGKNANFANIEMKLDCEIHHSISSTKNLFPEQWKTSSNEEDRPGLYRTFDHQGVQIRVGTSFTIDATVSNLTARPDEVVLTVMCIFTDFPTILNILKESWVKLNKNAKIFTGETIERFDSDQQLISCEFTRKAKDIFWLIPLIRINVRFNLHILMIKTVKIFREGI